MANSQDRAYNKKTSMQAGLLRDASVVDTERYALRQPGLFSWLAALAAGYWTRSKL